MTMQPHRPKRGFSPAEFETRLMRAQEIMRHHAFDALLLTTPPNIRYATGFDTQFWESPTRPWFVIVPASFSAQYFQASDPEPRILPPW